jgi:NADH:ubiquinone oxidoreductase subunit 2 (subunit N)
MLVLLLAQAGVPLTSGFLGKFYVIQASVQAGQYPLAIIAMLSAAVAAFFYLRLALLMYGGETRAGPPAEGAGSPEGGVLIGAAEGHIDRDDPELAGLEPVRTLDGPAASVALEAPPGETAPVPFTVALALTVCVVFTIFAGVSEPVIDLARHAVTLF